MTDSFSAAERRFVGPFRSAFARLTGPAVRALAALGVSPNAVSGSQIVLGGLIVVLMGSFPGWAVAIFFVTLILDGLDGALARATGKGSQFGALWDQVCDHTRETLMIAGLALHGALQPLPAVLYPLVYTVFNFLLFLCNHRGAPVPWAVKSYLVVYPALALYGFWGLNWMTPAVSLSIGFMLVTIAIALVNLRRVMG